MCMCLCVCVCHPVCVSCQERLSVEHILIHCAEYIDIRVSCFNVNTVRELFDTVPHVLFHLYEDLASYI